MDMGLGEEDYLHFLGFPKSSVSFDLFDNVQSVDVLD
jgi:hypothetical protein